MKLDPRHPLAARCVPAAVKPYRPALELPGFDEPLVTPAPDGYQGPPELLYPVRLELPYPPAVNNLYRVRAVNNRAFPYKTGEHTKYLEAVGACVGVVTPWPRDVRLVVTARLFRPRRIGDIDGPIKALFDALNGRAWVDDSQVVELHLTRHDDKHRPRVELEIQPAAPEETP